MNVRQFFFKCGPISGGLNGRGLVVYLLAGDMLSERAAGDGGVAGGCAS